MMVIDGKMLSRWAAMTCSTGTNRSSSGMTTKRDSSGGTLTLAIRSSPVTGFTTRTTRLSERSGDVGEGMALVDGQGGEDGEDQAVEDVVEIGTVVVRRGCASRT